MKYLDEYRDETLVRDRLADIRRTVTRPWTIMEVCGGQTHSIVKNGLDELLPPEITLVHGPGCPVCVTPLEIIDKALEIAGRPDVIFVSFGDMLRVPGSDKDLFRVKGEGGQVRVVYSPLDALKIARDHPDRQVVFFGIGFETTAPANAMAIWQAARQGVTNFSMLVSHVRVPPAITALLNSPFNQVQAFLLAGHVCTVMGYVEYEPIAAQYHVPMAVTGFEPVDILEGVRLVVRQLEVGQAQVENAYARSVRREGNVPAQQLMWRVFQVCDRKWRGIGLIPDGGMKLRAGFAAFDAELRFGLADRETAESSLCIAGQVLRGLRKPSECSAFGHQCTPEHPLGAPMVSAEGACAAYYHYGRYAREGVGATG
jgi:hydrogenase expression/formation protein HypD